MRIRSLLLGSAATLVAVTGTQAADAVIVEPEPVEYVRVCDAYGTGFFYIPGTETCISFNGFVRSAYEKLYIDGVIDGSLVGGVATSDPSFTLWGQRARLNVDTRNETDWGTLRAQYRLEGGQSNTDVDIDMDRALISIAGFRFGFSDNYWSTNHGYGWINGESVASNASGIAYEDGLYGFDDATLADYTFAANGFAVTVGAEDPRISYGRDGFGNGTNAGGTDGRANFYAGFNWSGSWGGLAFTAAHDSLAPEVNSVGVTTDVGGWAYKVSANLDLSGFVPGGTIAAYYMDDGDFNTDYVHTNLLTENPESIWGVAAQMDLSSEFQFWANYWHADGGNAITGGAPSLVAGNAPIAGTIQEGDVGQFAIGVNWYPAAAPGFHIKTTYFNGTVDNSASSLVNGSVGAGSTFDYDGWVVTIRRDF